MNKLSSIEMWGGAMRKLISTSLILSMALSNIGIVSCYAESEKRYKTNIKTNVLGRYQIQLEVLEEPKFKVLPTVLNTGDKYFPTSQNTLYTMLDNKAPQAVYSATEMQKVDVLYANSEIEEADLNNSNNIKTDVGNSIDTQINTLSREYIEETAVSPQEIIDNWKPITIQDGDTVSEYIMTGDFAFGWMWRGYNSDGAWRKYIFNCNDENSEEFKSDNGYSITNENDGDLTHYCDAEDSIKDVFSSYIPDDEPCVIKNMIEYFADYEYDYDLTINCTYYGHKDETSWKDHINGYTDKKEAQLSFYNDEGKAPSRYDTEGTYGNNKDLYGCFSIEIPGNSDGTFSDGTRKIFKARNTYTKGWYYKQKRIEHSDHYTNMYVSTSRAGVGDATHSSTRLIGGGSYEIEATLELEANTTYYFWWDKQIYLEPYHGKIISYVNVKEDILNHFTVGDANDEFGRPEHLAIDWDSQHEVGLCIEGYDGIQFKTDISNSRDYIVGEGVKNTWYGKISVFFENNTDINRLDEVVLNEFNGNKQRVFTLEGPSEAHMLGRTASVKHGGIIKNTTVKLGDTRYKCHKQYECKYTMYRKDEKMYYDVDVIELDRILDADGNEVNIIETTITDYTTEVPFNGTWDTLGIVFSQAFPIKIYDVKLLKNCEKTVGELANENSWRNGASKFLVNVVNEPTGDMQYSEYLYEMQPLEYNTTDNKSLYLRCLSEFSSAGDVYVINICTQSSSDLVDKLLLELGGSNGVVNYLDSGGNTTSARLHNKDGAYDNYTYHDSAGLIWAKSDIITNQLSGIVLMTEYTETVPSEVEGEEPTVVSHNVYTENPMSITEDIAEIIKIIMDNKKEKPSSWVLVGSDIEWKTQYDDEEHDPPFNISSSLHPEEQALDVTLGIGNHWEISLYDLVFDGRVANELVGTHVEKWRYTHNEDYYDNGLGNASFDAAWIEAPVSKFDKPGLYRVNYKRKDNPLANNDLTDKFNDYRKWSTNYDVLY